MNAKEKSMENHISQKVQNVPQLEMNDEYLEYVARYICSITSSPDKYAKSLIRIIKFFPKKL